MAQSWRQIKTLVTCENDGGKGTQLSSIAAGIALATSVVGNRKSVIAFRDLCFAWRIFGVKMECSYWVLRH